MVWSLEIHHINIGYGDSTAIIVRDDGVIKYKVLIDAGTDGTLLVGYLQNYLSDKRVEGGKNVDRSLYFDHIIVTHYHDDHIKGFSAIKNVFDANKDETILIGCRKFMDLGDYQITWYEDGDKKEDHFTPINGTGFNKQTSDMVTYLELIR